MDPLITGGLLKIGGSLLGGLFGRKKKAPTPAQNILSQAEGARAAAEKYGFNPLTMLQYGNPSGAMGAGSDGPPLASLDLLTGALQDFAAVATGEAAQDRALKQAEIDLRKIEAERLRSGVVSLPGYASSAPVAANAVGQGPSPLGGNTLTVPTYAGMDARSFGMAESPDQPVQIETMPHDPDLLSAQSAEDMYGEIGGAFQGIGNFVTTAFRNTFDPMREKPKARPKARPRTRAWEPLYLGVRSEW